MELIAIVTRAGGSALQLLEDFLQWDPERRPTAQQALKYPYFQMVKQNGAGVVQNSGGGVGVQRTLSTNQNSTHQPNSTQNHYASNNNNGRISNVSFSSLENTTVAFPNATASSTDKSMKSKCIYATSRRITQSTTFHLITSTYHIHKSHSFAAPARSCSQ